MGYIVNKFQQVCDGGWGQGGVPSEQVWTCVEGDPCDLWLTNCIMDSGNMETPPYEKMDKQKCAPVGCIPAIAVAICWGGVCLSACWDTPWEWAWRLPQVWAWRSPGCGPGDPKGQTRQLPPECGPEDPSGPDPSTSLLGVSWDTTPWRSARGYHPLHSPPTWEQTLPPPPHVDRILDTRFWKNITLPQTSFAGGKDARSANNANITIFV